MLVLTSGSCRRPVIQSATQPTMRPAAAHRWLLQPSDRSQGLAWSTAYRCVLREDLLASGHQAVELTDRKGR